MRALLFLVLILCNLIWSLNPVMGKVLFSAFTPLQVSFVRCFGAWLAMALYQGFSAALERDARSVFWLPPDGRRRAWLFLLGGAAFFFTPALSMLGLHSSSAIDNSLIVALEPLATVALAAWILGERPRRRHVFSFGFAVLGFALLSELTPARIAAGWSGHLIGNLLILASLLGEASYSVCYRKLEEQKAVRQIFFTSLTIGMLLLGALVAAVDGLPDPRVLWTDSRVLGAALYIGPIGTTLTYLFWLKALEYTSIPTLALSLFVQPLAGTIWGAAFLGERLEGLRLLGGGAILLAVAVPLALELRQKEIR